MTRGHYITVRLALSAAVILMAAATERCRAETAAAAAKLEYRQIDLKLPGRPQVLLAGDFTGDGLRDIVIIVGRKLHLYAGDAAAGFKSDPTASLDLPPDVVFTCGGDIGDPARYDVLFLGPEGVSSPVWNGRGFDAQLLQAVREPTLVRPPDDAQIRYLDFAQSCPDARGGDLLLLPTPNALRAYVNHDGKSARMGQIDVAMKVDTAWPDGAQIVPPSITVNYPRPYVGAFLEKGVTDVLVYTAGRLRVHRRDAGGFRPRADRVLMLDLPKRNTDAGDPLAFLGLPLDVVDLDGDGLCDVAVTQTTEGSTLIFLNRPGLGDHWDVHQTITVRGWTLAQRFVDLDGDGLKDLALVRIDKIGVFEAIKILITHTLTLNLQVFKAQPPAPDATGKLSTLYPRTPSYMRSVETPLVLSVAQNTSRVGLPYVMSVDGDFDGDGVQDLLVSTGAKELSIYRGGRAKVFEDRAMATIAVPDLTKVKFVHRHIADLNGDGRADLILRLESWQESQDRTIIYLSRKP